MIGARWANAPVGGNRMDHPAELQSGEEVTVTMASKALKVGQRGIQYGKVVLLEGTPEEIADCDSGKASPFTIGKKIRARTKPPKSGTEVPMDLIGHHGVNTYPLLFLSALRFWPQGVKGGNKRSTMFVSRVPPLALPAGAPFEAVRDGRRRQAILPAPPGSRRCPVRDPAATRPEGVAGRDPDLEAPEVQPYPELHLGTPHAPPHRQPERRVASPS